MPDAKVLGINTAGGTQVLSFYAVPFQAIQEPFKEWRAQLVIAPAATPTPTVVFETVEVGDRTYTVNEIRDPAPTRWALDVGERRVAIDVTIVALADEVIYTEFFFFVQDSEGFIYSLGRSADLNPDLSSGDLTRGQRTRGWVSFEVPVNAVLVSILAQAGYSEPRVVIADLSTGN